VAPEGSLDPGDLADVDPESEDVHVDEPTAAAGAGAFAEVSEGEGGRGTTRQEVAMATQKQRTAARRNVRKAQTAAKRAKTISKLPKRVRSDLGRQAAKARRRGGRPGHALEDRTRQDLYDEARRLGIAGRSKMGKWDLIDAIRRSR
jgi:hypothetical protein